VVELLADETLHQTIALAGRRLVEEKYNWRLIESNLAVLIS